LARGRKKTGKGRRARSACPRDGRGRGERSNGRAVMIVVTVTAI